MQITIERRMCYNVYNYTNRLRYCMRSLYTFVHVFRNCGRICTNVVYRSVIHMHLRKQPAYIINALRVA